MNEKYGPETMKAIYGPEPVTIANVLPIVSFTDKEINDARIALNNLENKFLMPDKTSPATFLRNYISKTRELSINNAAIVNLTLEFAARLCENTVFRPPGYDATGKEFEGNMTSDECAKVIRSEKIK
jgi:hypothetical protein